MDVIDPTVELVPAFRTVVILLLVAGRVALLTHTGQRMNTRHVIVPQIEATLRSGALASESYDASS